VALPDTPQQQLDWEARHRPRAALAAAFAGIAIVVGPLVESAIEAGAPSLPVLDALRKLAAPGTIYDQPSLQVPYGRYIADHATELIAARIVMGLGFIALTYAVTFLAAATRSRRPEFARWAFYLPIVAGVLFAVSWVALGVGRVIDANEVVDGAGTIGAVQDLGATGLSQLSRVLLTPAALALAVGIVLVSLNAMRAGLLTRFMGALGIVVGVFQVVQVGSSLPLVQTFWLGGLALLFAGRRPGGDPPAWRTGRAEPWPSAKQLAEQRRAQAEAEAAGGAAPAAPTAPAEPERVPAGAHPATSKRKRKRRT
jgi:hypothetical protein